MKPEKIHQLIQVIAACNATPEEGVTRFSYSAEDGLARAAVLSELAALGLETYTDWAGNIHALLPGADPKLSAVMVGSHLDSVRNGGRFDGIVGVVGGLAVLSRLKNSTLPPARPVRFAAFAEEEGSNFSLPLLGSKAFTGKLTPSDLAEIRTPAGENALNVIAAGTPPPLPAPEWVSPDTVYAMTELHIEQSGSLHDAGADIGIVDVIASDMVLTVSVSGRSGHSGASAMRGRKDALTGAAEMITEAEKLACSPGGEGAVITVGRIDVRPNAFNCIPDAVIFTADLRHPDPQALRRVTDILQQRIRSIAEQRGLGCCAENKFTPGVTLDPVIRAASEKAAEALRLSWKTTPSWAMHDAGAIAQVTRAGMIFIPSTDGISHNPAEFTGEKAIEKGIDVLYAVVAGLAGQTA